MPQLWDRALSAILTLAALVVAAVLVHREFLAAPSVPGPVVRREASYVSTWRDALPAGRTVGSPSASIVVVVFSDLQCPYCRLFHSSMNAALDRYPGQVAYSFVHFPLPGHRHAVDAARAAECANDAGRFGETLDFIFANQDSLGIRDWTWFAAGAGVADLEGFTECMTDRAIPVTVAMGLALERTMNITGTPAVFLNGWRYPGMPSEAEFLQAIDDLVAGRKPYDKFPEGAIRAQR